MNLPQIVGELRGVVENFRAALAGANESAAKIAALTTERDSAKAELAKLNAEREALAAKLNDAEAAKTKADEAAAAAAKAAEELSAKEQDLDKRASAKALEIVAAQGVTAPVTQPKTDPKSEVPAGPDGKPLRGLALAQYLNAKRHA